MPKDPDVLTVGEAADLLGVHAQSVYAALRSGRLPGRKVGRVWRLHRPALLEWLSATEDPRLAGTGGDEGDDDGDGLGDVNGQTSADA